MFCLDNNCYGQWKELNSIFKNQNKHILINFVYDYPKEHLFLYTQLILEEFIKRNYKIKNTLNMYNYFNSIDAVKCWLIKYYDEVFKDKMNDIYLRECLYNLEEKFICNRHI